MFLSMIAMFLMWCTFRFKFKTRGAVASILFVIGVSFLPMSKHVLGLATATALLAGATTIALNYAKMLAKSMSKFTRRLNEVLSSGMSKMKR